MPTPRRRITQAEALELLAEWQASMLPLPGWCAENGVDGRSLRTWANRLHAPSAVRLLELSLPALAPVPPVRLSLGVVQIDVPDGFNDRTLARLLAVLRGCRRCPRRSACSWPSTRSARTCRPVKRPQPSPAPLLFTSS